MDLTSLLSPQLLAVATAAGLVSGGQTQWTWFDNPLGHLGSVLSDAGQQAALFDLLDQVVPPVTVPGAPGAASWHPLLPAGGTANVYLTVDQSPAEPVVGIAAGCAGPTVSLLAAVPLVAAPESGGKTGFQAIAGTAAGPLTVSLAVQTALTTAGGDPVGLDSAVITAEVSAAGFSVSATLRGLSLDGEPPHDVTLDPAELGDEAAQLLIGLLRAQLAKVAGQGGQAAVLADSLPALLGLGPTAVPAFPVTTLASDPQALAKWFASLVAGDPPPIGQWLTGLAALLGLPAPAAAAPPGGPWTLTLPAAGSSQLSLVFTASTGSDGVTPLLGVGVALGFLPSQDAPVRLELDATLVQLPLAGSGTPVVLPSASFTAVAPSASAGPLVPPGSTGGVSLGSARGGLSWNGTGLAPLLELTDVTFAGQDYPVVDLSDAGSVAAAAAAAVVSALESALGDSPAAGHLLALIGLTVPGAGPATVPAAGPPVNLAQLVTRPLSAIAAVHRASLATGTPPWSAYFNELLGLLGLPACTGAGSEQDPWQAPLASAGPLSVQLAAWNAQTSGNPADPQQLRIGIRLQIAASAAAGWWLSELIAIDLPASAAASVRLLAGHHAAVTLTPGTVDAVAGTALSADSLAVTAELSAGAPPAVGLTATNLLIGLPEGTVTVPSLSFPFPAGFDITSPAATLGLTPAQLQTLVLGFALRQLTSTLGSAGAAVAALSGLSAALPGLQADFPQLGQLNWADPLATLRTWFGQVAAGLSADGTAFIASLAGWLCSLLAGTLPDDPATMPGISALTGTGTYADPFTLPLGGSGLAGLLWLDPGGPVASPVGLVSALTGAPDLGSLVSLLTSAGPLIPALAPGLDPTALAAGLQSLSDYLSSGDGLVPVTSQAPAASGWATGTPVPAAHALQPSDPSARAQIIAQLDSWAAAGSRAVLLLGPAFTDHAAWAGLLADIETAHPGTTSTAANFSFRLPGVAPAQVDLRTVTAAVDFYTADLNDDGIGDTAGLSSQIGLVLARIAALRPGVPVYLVAHSTAGLAACAYAAASQGQVHGLITLGTPFGGAPLTPLTDPATAEAVRWYATQLPGGLPAGPLNDALATLCQALDGYQPAATAGDPATAWPFPAGDFAGLASSAAGGVPALAITGQLGGTAGVSLLASLGAALAAQLPAAPAVAPTAIGLGLRLALDFGTGTGSTGAAGTGTAGTGTAGTSAAGGAPPVAVDAYLRADLAEIPLPDGTSATPRAVPVLSAGALLYRPGGWLAGGPLSYAGVGVPDTDVRVRSLELGLAVSGPAASRTAQVTATLRDAACHGPTAATVGWGDPGLEAALGAVFQAITAVTPDPGTSLGGLLAFLQSAGVVTADPHGGLGIAADALTALAADPLGYLGPKVPAGLAAAGLPGLGAPAVPGQWNLPGAGIQVALTTSAASTEIAVGTAAGSPLTLAPGITLGFQVSVDPGALTATGTATLGAGPVTLSWAPGTLTFGAGDTLAPVSLLPPPPSAAVFGPAVLALLVDTAGSALLESLLGPGYSASGLLDFLTDPGAWLTGPQALGGPGGLPDPAKLNALLSQLALPGGFSVTAGSAAGPPAATTLTVATTADIGGVLGVTLQAAIDSARHVVPSGSLTISLAGLTGGWGSVTITLTAGPAGLGLTVNPGQGASPIELLPAFSGPGALAGAAAALLPQVLTALTGGGLIPEAVLSVAQALGVYNPASSGAPDEAAAPATAAPGSWDTTALQQLTSPGWFNGFAGSRTQLIQALVTALNTPGLDLPVTASAAAGGTALVLSYPASAQPAGAPLAVTVGWNADGPLFALALTPGAIGQSPVAGSVSAGWAAGALTLSGFIGADLSAIGLPVTPGLSLAITAGQPAVSLLPLGAGTQPAIQLLPGFAVQGLAATGSADPVAELIGQWALPLIGGLLLDVSAVQTGLGTAIGGTGPTPGAILEAAGIVTAAGSGPCKLAVPLPPLADLPGRIAAGAAQVTPGAGWPAVQLTQDLTLQVAAGQAGLGVTLAGSVALSQDGDPQVTLLAGAPSSQLGPGAGVSLTLFSAPGGLSAASAASVQFTPKLSVLGLGLGLAGAGDDPLLSSSFIRVQGVDGFVAFDLDFTASQPLSQVGGGADFTQLGLPLGAIDSTTSDNPVAASLLGSLGSDSGDQNSALPAADIGIRYLNGALSVVFATGQPVVIPVQQAFGPLYIEQLQLSTTGTSSVEAGVTGSVQVAGLAVDLDQLALSVPIASLGDPGTWQLDLQGLAVAYSDPDVDISGGLIKVSGPSAIEYDGMLSVSISGLGITAVGSYARPGDAQGQYTSVFIFATVLAPLGGPPFLFVTGLAGGLGYNRAIQVPADVTGIPAFVLVEALSGDALANDPMSALTQLGSEMPPVRGAYWLAAGLDFTSFSLVNTTAVVVIALNKGFEIDVLGVSRMALPSESAALVSVELALKARYNSAEGVLSVQAQLTDNSYLFSPDCQLTGGFAFFIWFDDGQFVLTLGGYNAVFAKPPQFPDVPRLGFLWDFGGYLVIKGAAYFALTETCVMAGGSLSATLTLGPVSAWLDAYLDILICWDPFSYEFDVGVEIGVSLNIQVCFFGCVTIGVSVSEGAQLSVSGPPFHGTASIEAYVTTVTFSFGPQSDQVQLTTDWSAFAGKYLTAGDPNQSAVSAQLNGGILPPAPPGAQPQPGTAAQPWQVGAEFSFTTTTRMPASQVTVSLPVQVAAPAGLNEIDLAPMGVARVTSTHSVTVTPLTAGAGPAGGAGHFTATPVTGPFPEATWHYIDPQQIPAAARTITAIAGLAVGAQIVLTDASAVIPFGSLVDDEPKYARPLPFASTVTVSGALKVYGGDADDLLASVAGAPVSTVAGAIAAVLSADGVTGAASTGASPATTPGADVFAQARASLGLPAAGLPPLALAALAGDRSAPPLVTSIATGLTMLPVGLPAARLPAPFKPDLPVLLGTPRLKAVLRSTAAPVIDTPPAVRTSVTTVAAAANAPRMAPPVPVLVPGARLITVPAAAAPRPTLAAVSSRTVRNGDLGAPVGPAAQQQLAAAASDLVAGGVTLGAGTWHLWEIPSGAGRFTVAGGTAARMVCLDRAGAVLADTEFTAPATQSAPAGTELVAVGCLGAPPASLGGIAAGPGAVSLAAAPAGAWPAVGWQASSELAQAGPAVFLGRGAVVTVPSPVASVQHGRKASSGMVTASDVVAGQRGVQTTMPSAVDVVIIALDVADATAARQDDLAIGVAGATLTAPPVRVQAGDRLILLYPVTGDTGDVFTLAVASAKAWTVAATAGVRGSTAQWAATLAAGLPDQFVPDGPLAPGGAATATYTVTGAS